MEIFASQMVSFFWGHPVLYFASKALGIPPGSYFAMSSSITMHALGSVPVVNVNDCVIALSWLIILSLWFNV